MNGRTEGEDHTLKRVPITNCTIGVLLEIVAKYVPKHYGINTVWDILFFNINLRLRSYPRSRKLGLG